MVVFMAVTEKSDRKDFDLEKELIGILEANSSHYFPFNIKEYSEHKSKNLGLNKIPKKRYLDKDCRVIR